MAHAQKPDFVFRRNGRVHLNRRGCQFSRLLAAEVCASAVVMLVSPRSEVVWEYWLPTPFASFPFTSPPVHHRVPSRFKRTLPWVPCESLQTTAPHRAETRQDIYSAIAAYEGHIMAAQKLWNDVRVRCIQGCLYRGCQVLSHYKLRRSRWCIPPLVLVSIT